MTIVVVVVADISCQRCLRVNNLSGVESNLSLWEKQLALVLQQQRQQQQQYDNHHNDDAKHHQNTCLDLIFPSSKPCRQSHKLALHRPITVANAETVDCEGVPQNCHCDCCCGVCAILLLLLLLFQLELVSSSRLVFSSFLFRADFSTDYDQCRHWGSPQANKRLQQRCRRRRRHHISGQQAEKLIDAAGDRNCQASYAYCCWLVLSRVQAPQWLTPNKPKTIGFICLAARQILSNSPGSI